MREVTIDAVLDNMPTAVSFVEEELERLECPMKVQMQIDIAVDELLGNIIYYAYPENVGKATIQIEMLKSLCAVRLTFIDSGIPYNPLEKKDPDVTLSAEERQIGGLGIYMVKKSMDGMDYVYRDGKNVLRIWKQW